MTSIYDIKDHPDFQAWEERVKPGGFSPWGLTYLAEERDGILYGGAQPRFKLAHVEAFWRPLPGTFADLLSKELEHGLVDTGPDCAAKDFYPPWRALHPGRQRMEYYWPIVKLIAENGDVLYINNID